MGAVESRGGGMDPVSGVALERALLQLCRSPNRKDGLFRFAIVVMTITNIVFIYWVILRLPLTDGQKLCFGALSSLWSTVVMVLYYISRVERILSIVINILLNNKGLLSESTGLP